MDIAISTLLSPIVLFFLLGLMAEARRALADGRFGSWGTAWLDRYRGTAAS